jgi:transaldolase
MELYIDTANLDDIKEAMSLGILEGVTTNPTLVAREKRQFQELIREIAPHVPGKIWCEVIGLDAESMIREARDMAAWAPKVVVKLPMGKEGIKAASTLSREGVETNMTLVYSVAQAVLAAKAGVAYVSPYLNRVDEIGWSGAALIGNIVKTFADLRLGTKVIAASIKGPQQVLDVLNLGVDAVTMSCQVLYQMMNNPMTDIGLSRFLADWKAAGLYGAGGQGQG